MCVFQPLSGIGIYWLLWFQLLVTIFLCFILGTCVTDACGSPTGALCMFCMVKFGTKVRLVHKLLYLMVFGFEMRTEP